MQCRFAIWSNSFREEGSVAGNPALLGLNKDMQHCSNSFKDISPQIEQKVRRLLNLCYWNHFSNPLMVIFWCCFWLEELFDFALKAVAIKRFDFVWKKTTSKSFHFVQEAKAHLETCHLMLVNGSNNFSYYLQMVLIVLAFSIAPSVKQWYKGYKRTQAIPCPSQPALHGKCFLSEFAWSIIKLNSTKSNPPAFPYFFLNLMSGWLIFIKIFFWP